MYSSANHAATAGRAQFASDGLETASNARIVVLCFDRLDRDMAHALDGIERQDMYDVNDALGHAQDLLGELATMLDLEAWEHAGSLLALYDYLLRLLQAANVHKAANLVDEARLLLTELGDAFRSAANAAPAAEAAPADPGPAVEPDVSRWSVSA